MHLVAQYSERHSFDVGFEAYIPQALRDETCGLDSLVIACIRGQGEFNRAALRVFKQAVAVGVFKAEFSEPLLSSSRIVRVIRDVIAEPDLVPRSDERVDWNRSRGKDRIGQGQPASRRREQLARLPCSLR